MQQKVEPIKDCEETIELNLKEELYKELFEIYSNTLDNIISSEHKKFVKRLKRRYIRKRPKYVSFEKFNLMTTNYVDREFERAVRQIALKRIISEKYVKGKRKVNLVKIVRQSIQDRWMLMFGI